MLPIHRRHEPRVAVDAMCLEMDDQLLRCAHIVDVSESGLRIQRPSPSWRAQVVQLEFAIPGIDEVMWASGQLRFDTPGQGEVEQSGILVLNTTNRHRRMLREFVNDTWESPEFLERDWLRNASCYFRS